MDKSLLMYRGGVRTAKKTLADGNDHTLHYKAKTPTEIALFVGAQGRLRDKTDEQSDVAWQKLQAQFIASSLCNEDGSPLLTEAEALLIPTTLKPEICWLITSGSNEAGGVGNA